LLEEAARVFELSPHLDDFALLRFTTGELEEPEHRAATQHLEGCSDCAHLLVEVRRLDAGLQVVAAEDPAVFSDPEGLELPAGDPFRERPEVRAPVRDRSLRPEQVVELAVEASKRGAEGRDRLLEALRDAGPSRAALDQLSLSDAADRFTLLYALQEAGPRVAEDPPRMLRFSQGALQRLRARNKAESTPNDRVAERLVPLRVLFGQAHLLAGKACIWTGDYDVAQTHARLAYSWFARAGDELGLATVEILEAQRRYFTGAGEEALVLARRAAATFQVYGLEDSLARARGVEGIALFRIGRVEEALAAHRSTLPVFEAHGLWTNYVLALNNSAVYLVKLGRLDEARREYARALRLLSGHEHTSILAFIRHGLAEVLFATEHYREAARSVGHAHRLYVACGLRANALAAWLFEVESWARSGDLERAHETLAAFKRSLAADPSLDPSVARDVEKALSGLAPDFRNIADLRQQAELALPPSWRGMSA
jgi:tetratricopeptide (TPR) repeat protein